MGLKIHYPAPVVAPGGLVADRRLCVDRSWRVLLEETDPAAASLLAAKGREIPAAVVKRLQLRLVEGRVVQGPADPAEVAVAPQPIMPPEVRRTRGRRKK